MGFHSFFRDLEDDVKGELSDFDDSVRGVASDADDWRRENPILSAMIPFTPENQALMAGGGALLAGGSALGGLIGSGAGAAGAGAAGAGAAGLGSLGQLGLGLGQIGAGIYGAKQAGKAADAQIEAGNYAAQLAKESADKQLELQKQIWEKQQADYKPYLEQGTWSINRLGDLMKKGSGQLNNPFDTYLASKGLAGGQFNQNNPQYQFLLKQGQQALDRSAAARGMGYSGAQMKAAQQFGQGLASQEYDKQYARASGEFGDYFNRLAGLSQGGQQAAGSTANAGSQYASNAGNTFANLSNAQTGILGQQANARASAYATKANALNDTLGGLADLWSMRRKAV